MKGCSVVVVALLFSHCLYGSEEDTLRELQELDQSQIQFDFYQRSDSDTPNDEQNLINAIELLENAIDSAKPSPKKNAADLNSLDKTLPLDSQDNESQLNDSLEEEMESNIEQGIEDIIYDALEEYLEEDFNEDLGQEFEEADEEFINEGMDFGDIDE